MFFLPHPIHCIYSTFLLQFETLMVQTVLIVEDDKGLQKYLKELLLDNGYAVHTASDGIAALEYFKKAEPDLVVLDLGLPNMTGEAVCQEIRKKYRDIPIIILTAKDSI